MNRWSAVAILILGFGWFTSLTGQEVNCTRVAAIAAMARAKSPSELRNAKRDAGNDYRAQLVFAYRAFRLRPTATNAEQLLSRLPDSASKQNTAMTLGDSLCDRESLTDMETLSRVSANLPEQFAKAVLLKPQLMSLYVVYSFTAVQDPHSDYPVRMEKVCRQDHTAFSRAVEQLPKDKQDWFKQHIMNVDSCKALSLPESN